MAFAAANDHVVLTNDLDFAAILASTHHKKPSVVQIRTEDLDPNVIGTQIVAALQRAHKELEAGALLTIEADRTRLRMLPFAIEPYQVGWRSRLPGSGLKQIWPTLGGTRPHDSG